LLGSPPDNRFSSAFDQVIAYKETNVKRNNMIQLWHQYDTSTAPAGGPVDSEGKPTAGLPLQSADLIGYGIMQISNPAPTLDKLWDWASDVAAGVSVIQIKYY